VDRVLAWANPDAGKTSVSRLVIVQRQSELLEVVPAAHAIGCFSRLLNSRQKQRDEHANDGDHDQQLNEREAVPRWTSAA